MALVESLEISLGTKMPEFNLKDPYNKIYKSDALFGNKGLLVVFTCNHCPYAKAVWPRLVKLANYSKTLSINTVTINPNIHPDYPEDAPDKMKDKIKELSIDFPYLIDETQNIARAFKAQCTPDPYLFDKNHALVYHGRIDDNWKDESLVKKQDLKDAILNLVNQKPIEQTQYASMGCSIKWKE
jgi:peroxiredoxin